MKGILRKMLYEGVTIFIITFAVQLLWTILELIYYKEIQYRIVDDYIEIILVLSLYNNYINSKNRRM